jgi:hypothetical protein
MEIIPLKDPNLGIYLYKNVLNEEMNLVNRLEEIMENDKDNFIKWSEALVGDYQKMPSYRDCFDFKVGDEAAKSYENLGSLYYDIKEKLYDCLAHYQSIYNVNMEYMEAINFVKYGVGQHFQVHADHGFSYSCTISSVMYLNDGYEGGELWFPYIDLTLKPEYGDIVLFPSTYIYSHASLPVKSGTKYAAVTMFDYNDRTHGANSITGGRYGKNIKEKVLVK